MAIEIQSGTMPARGFDWDAVKFQGRRIGEVVSLNYGKALQETTRRPGLVRVYGTNGPCGYHDTPLAAGPGVVLGRKGQGHLGVKWVKAPFWVIDTAYYASVAESDVDLRWFYFVTHHVGLDHLKTGEKPGLSRELFGRQIFPFPKIDEQRAIARVLGALDDKIELNRRMNRTLEELAAALFRSWFVDFDPVVAKAAGRKPAHLRPALAALFPATFQDSPLGPIPHGWRIESIYTAADVIYGATFASGKFNTAGMGKPLIRIRNLPDDNSDTFTTEVHPKGYLVRPGDIVVGMDGEFRAYLWGGEESWLNQRLCVFSPKPNFSAPFVRCAITAPLAEVEATELATTVIHLGKQDIDRFQFVFPPPEVLARFNEISQPWYDQIVHNRRESRTLAALRDTLLPKLLSGELRVKTAEKLVEATV